MRVRSAVAIALLVGCGSTAKPPSDASLRSAAFTSGDISIPFAASSPFNLPVPMNAVLDPRSSEMVAQLARKKSAHAALYEFAIPIWDADASTPRLPVRCAMSPAWGPCPFAGTPVLIPGSAHPHSGSDGAMVVIDRSAQKTYEFWQIRREGELWVTSWGAVQDLLGSGWSRNGSSTASGASRLGGVVRVDEIATERIPHAL